MNNPKTILSTSDVTIGYKTKKTAHVVAEKLNLTVQEGKLIALIGANGMGKSTLLRTLTGIQKPLSGSVLLHDQNIHKIDQNIDKLSKIIDRSSLGLAIFILMSAACISYFS